MILCGENLDVGVGVSGQEWATPPRKDIGRKEERPGRVNNRYVTISDGA